MECVEAIQSIETAARLVIEHDPTTGCGNVRTKGDTIAGETDCTKSQEGDLTLINRAIRTDVPAVRVASSNVALAALCSTYALRMECEDKPGLSTMFREAAGYNAAGEVVIRARKVTGAAAKCDDDCTDETLRSRIGASFITAAGKTYVLLIADTTGDPLECEDVEVSWLTMLAGSLSSVGTCGMWAWKVSTP